MSASYADVSYSQARLGTDRSPQSDTTLAGAEQPIAPELIAACRRVVEDSARRLGWDSYANVFAMFGLDEGAS